jgi:Zn-dependent protease with chaperone function
MYSHPGPVPALSETPIVESPIRVRRWPTERPLLYLNALVSGALWVVFLSRPRTFGFLLVTIAIMLLMNVALIAQVRGSAVKLGPDQFPELYARVEELARRMGLRRAPEVYLRQEDGALNAFATRFLRAHFVVLLSDLLDACGDDRAARDMIIGHELGHIRAGHLQLRWLLLPTGFIPFLSATLSRAREYTCDRYGLAAAGDREGALLGLTILAAGPKYGRQVNRTVFARQRSHMQLGWMMLGEWLASHPPLSKRLHALEPEPALAAEALPAGGAPHADGKLLMRAWRPTFALTIVLLVAGFTISAWMPMQTVLSRAPDAPESPFARRQQVDRDFGRLRLLLDGDLVNRGHLPWDTADLYKRWSQAYGADDEGPSDPFTGYWYEYDRDGSAYRLRSGGPDGETDTEDDIVFDSRTRR